MILNKRLQKIITLIFGTSPSIEDLVKAELYEAEVDLLQAYTNRDIATATVTYHSSRVARLRNKLETTPNTATL